MISLCHGFEVGGFRELSEEKFRIVPFAYLEDTTHNIAQLLADVILLQCPIIVMICRLSVVCLWRECIVTKRLSQNQAFFTEM